MFRDAATLRERRAKASLPKIRAIPLAPLMGLALMCLALACFGCGSAAPQASPTPAVTATPSPSPVPTPTPSPVPTPAPTPRPIPFTAFLPDPYGQRLTRVESVLPEDSPLALIDELVRLGLLPDIDYGRTVYFEVGDSYIKNRGGARLARVVARLDVSDRFSSALSDMSKSAEVLCLQGLANTFLTYYNAESFMLTVNGVKLVTKVRDYESGITFDQYAKTRD